MNAKSVAERVSDHRSRLRADGMVKLELWVHPNDVTRLKRDAAGYAARRERLLKDGVVLSSVEHEDARLVAAARKGQR